MKQNSFFSRRKSRIFSLVSYALLALFVIFLTSKAFYLPLAFITSTHDSEVSRQWDLLIGVASYISTPTNGSHVVVCRSGYWNTACLCGTAVVVNGVNGNGNGVNGNGNDNGHRLLFKSNGRVYALKVNGNSNGVNGNNNGNGNNFLLKSNGRVYALKANGNGNGNGNGGAIYVIVATVPRELWIPVVAISMGASVILILRGARRGVSSFRKSLDPAISLSILVLLLNSLATGSVYIAQEGSTYALPGLQIRMSFDPVASILTIEVLHNGTYELMGASCRLGEDAPGGLANKQLEIQVLENDTIIAYIPMELYEAIYNESVELPFFLPIGMGVVRSATARCNLLFREGSVRVSAFLETVWRDPLVSVEDGEVIIVNRNPAALAIRAVVYDIKRSTVIEDLGLVIERFSEARVDLRKYSGSLAVYVYYNLFEPSRSQVLYIDKP